MDLDNALYRLVDDDRAHGDVLAARVEDEAARGHARCKVLVVEGQAVELLDDLALGRMLGLDEAADRPEDWIRILEELLAGSDLAFLKLNGLITGYLVRLRAYEFQDEWDDLRQEIVLSVVGNAEAGRLRDPQALLAYVRIITRNKVLDRVKRRVSHREKDTVTFGVDPALDGALGLSVPPPDDARRDLWAALGDLLPQEQRAIHGVYLEGKTYEAVAAETGIPLGTLKRRLRDGLAGLRRRLLGAS